MFENSFILREHCEECQACFRRCRLREMVEIYAAEKDMTGFQSLRFVLSAQTRFIYILIIFLLTGERRERKEIVLMKKAKNKHR